jgi:hypothetical protein
MGGGAFGIDILVMGTRPKPKMQQKNVIWIELWIGPHPSQDSDSMSELCSFLYPAFDCLPYRTCDVKAVVVCDVGFCQQLCTYTTNAVRHPMPSHTDYTTLHPPACSV